MNVCFTLISDAWTMVLDARRRVKLFWPTLACSCSEVGCWGERSGEGRRCARGGAAGSLRFSQLSRSERKDTAEVGGVSDSPCTLEAEA